MRRVEDRRLITGQGRYANDIRPEGALHVAFCRSPVPHARIRAVDRSGATDMPGVVAVWTAEDLPEIAAGLSDFGPPGLEQRGRPIMNRDEVNYAGEAYALVVAETNYGAHDAVEAMLAELDPLPAVAGGLNSIAGGAPLVHGEMKSNVASSTPTQFGDIGAAFAADSVVAKVSLRTDRVAGAATRVRPLPARGGSSMSQRNELAAKRGYHYRMSRRAFLVSASAAALAACAPSGSTGGNAASSAAATAAATAGKAMKIGLRGSGGDRAVTLEAQSPPADYGIRILRDQLGVTVRPIRGGLRISIVDGRGAAAGAGLETGDVVVAVNGERVGEVADLNKLLSRDHARTTLLMTVARGAWEYTLTFPLN